jgi:hypothetical protein
MIKYRKLEKKNYDAYISYHPAQFKQVEHYVDLLRNSKLKVWFDCDQGTENDFERNVNALKSSQILVCFQSEEYNKSLKNKAELSLALKTGKDIVKLVSSKKYKIKMFKS